ncbi:MAG: preprotein translocase subunit YajC [Rhodospirillales bacterium]|nr:preprotein translocase subunit YajC [Rhodospirillales bacterium]
MFVSTAFAQDAAPAAAAGPDAMLQFLPIILIFVVFYFLLIRPQQKKLKVHKEMLSALRRGDRVVTGGGIIGTITRVVDDNEVLLEIAEGVRVRVQRPMISGVLAKTEPATETKEPPRGGDGPTGGGGGSAAAGEGEAKPVAPRPSRLTKILGGKRD